MPRYLLILISILVLSCSPVIKNQTVHEAKVWEDDIQKFEQLDKTITYPKTSILFAGSSSIRLWSTIDKDMAPYTVIQRGFGGSRLNDLSVYANRIIDPHPCSAIVLFVANDITGNKDDKSPKEVASLFLKVLKTIRKTHPETPVFWIEVTPTPLRWNVWPQIQKASTLIKHICDNQRNTYFIKTDFAFLNEQGVPKDELFIDDKLHLTGNGYSVWTGIIKKELDKVLK
jgi:lysophospholipase L1-like esterase